MNNEPFHIMAQDWRYQSRSKSLITTLHVGQLPSDVTGETILIDPVAPPAMPPKPRGYGVPPIVLPPAPGGGGTINVTVNVKCTCFGCVSWDKQILAQRNMDISMSPWDDTVMTITMIPHEQGRFMYGLFGQSAVLDFSKFPSTGISVQLLRGTGNPLLTQNQVDSASNAITMGGIIDATHWNSGHYITAISPVSLMGYVQSGKDAPLIGRAVGGIQAEARFSMWLFKIGEQ